MYITTLHWGRHFIEKKKCYNVTVPVTMFKYLPFSAGKTTHLDRLCLENSLKESSQCRSTVCLFVIKKIILRLSKHKCFVTQFVTNNL